MTSSIKLMQIKAETDCVVNHLKFKNNDMVKAGDEIIQIEVCKMMIPIITPTAGTITYKCKMYDYVVAGQILAEVE